MSVFVLLIFLCLVKDIHGQTECSEGSVRLVGGPTADEGRVEYCTGGRWGTICDDMWGLEDAAVVCTQLGFTPFGDERRGVDSSVPSEGAASLPIVLSGLDCVGTESGLAECNHSAPISQCSHSRDAGVRCQCRSEELRFVEGAAANEGRVEYCVGGEWRIICLEGITSEAATVMCRQLGFDPIDGFLSQVLDPFEFNRATIFERTDNAVLLRYPNRLQCSGAESRLANCPMTPFLDIVDDCTSSGVGLRCPTNETGVGAVCNYGEIRLQDGLISAQFGRVEVCFNGQWGVVCGINHFFDGLDAAVACRQLGIEGASVVVGPAPIDLFGFDPDNLNFGRLAVLDDLMCVGNEANLIDCPHRGATIENCQSPFADANVICGISVDRCPDEGISTTVVPQSGEAFPLANFGQCEHYGAQSSFCNEVIPSAGYVYASAAVSLSQVVNQLDIIALSINRDDPECQELVSMVLCNYFFPSCGSVNGVHRPTAVCSDVCFYVAKTCSETWSQVQSALAFGSLGRVNCSDTTTRLSGLHGCCSSANITIPGSAGNLTIIPSKSLSVLLGDYISLNCSSTPPADVDISYTWTHLNTSTVLEETSNIVTFPRIFVEELGTYRCSASSHFPAEVTITSARPLIETGSYPARITSGSCPSPQLRDDILVDVLQLLSAQFGVHPLGLTMSYAAESCDQVAEANPGSPPGMYWIYSDGNPVQVLCQF